MQVQWISLRIRQIKEKEAEAEKIKLEKIKEKENFAKEELKSVPEPSIVNIIPKGGKLWFEFCKEEERKLKCDIWLETDRQLKRADLKIFYPSEILQLADQKWQEKNGLALQTVEIKENVKKFKVSEITFFILQKGKAELEFDFSKESSLDCNLIDFSESDILEETKGIVIDLLLK